MKYIIFVLLISPFIVGCGEIENKNVTPAFPEQKEANKSMREVPESKTVQSEGPLGDMDGDGIPNKDDSDPLGLDKGEDEGPNGDIDADGIPNKNDSDPLGQE